MSNNLMPNSASAVTDLMATFPYWTDRRLLVHVDGPDGERSIELDRPIVRVGYDSRCEVILDGAGDHNLGLYLHATQEGIFAFEPVPMSSDQQPLAGWIGPDQLLSVGDIVIRATFAEGPPPRTDLVSDLNASESMSSLVPIMQVVTDQKRQTTFPLTRRLTIIGRARPCSLRVKDDQIGMPHCALYWHNGKLWVIDLLSRNGTLLRGEPCDIDRLHIGQALRLGGTRLKFVRIAHCAPAESAAGVPHDDSIASQPTNELLSASDMHQRIQHERLRWKAQQHEKQLKLQTQLRRLEEQLQPGATHAAAGSDGNATLLDTQGSGPDPLTNLREQLEQERERLSRLNDQLDAESAQLAKQRAQDREYLQAAERELDLQRDRLQHEQNEIKSEQARIESERKQLESERLQLEANRTETSSSRAALESDQRQHDSVRARLDAAQRRLENDRAEQQRDRELMQREREQLIADRKQLEAAARKLDVDKGPLKTAQEKLDTERQRLSADRVELAHERQQLERDQKAVVAEREKLESVQAEWQGKARQFAARDSLLREQEEALQTQRAQIEADLKNLHATQDDMATRQSQLEKKQASLDSQREQLASNLKQVQAERKQLEAERAGSQAKTRQPAPASSTGHTSAPPPASASRPGRTPRMRSARPAPARKKADIPDDDAEPSKAAAPPIKPKSNRPFFW